MPNTHNIEEIEAYLRDQMDAKARADFEAQMASDATLRQEVEAYRKIFLGFGTLREKSFEKDVQKWAKSKTVKHSNSMKQKKHQQAKTRNLNPMWQRIAVAASIVVIAFAAWLYFQGSGISNEQLAKNAYVAPLSSNTMGAQDDKGQTLVNQFDTGHKLFQEGKYDEATATLKDFINAVQNNKETFDPLSKQFYLESAQWTVLLCDFATGKMDDVKMKKILALMAKKTNSDFAPKAKEMLESLEKRSK